MDRVALTVVRFNLPLAANSVFFSGAMTFAKTKQGFAPYQPLLEEKALQMKGFIVISAKLIRYNKIPLL